MSKLVMTTYSPERQLIKDFIRWASDTHKCAMVAFPDEFTNSRYINYRFMNTCELLDEFIQERVK